MTGFIGRREFILSAARQRAACGARAAGRGFQECAWDSRASGPRPVLSSVASNDQCKQFNRADSYHQRCECYRIVIEPMPLL